MLSFNTIVSLGLLATADLVAGHAAIIAATGDAGGSGMAIGVDTSTPRDGTRRRPFQQDSTRFRGDQEDTIGETIGAGDNNLEQGTQAILAETGDQLPQVTPGGEVSMTLHQVNADGAGPYTCEINADGTAQTWESIQVTQSPPGDDSRDRDGEATDFPLTAAVPADQECTGTVAGEENVCLVRCMNGARAGPFGGVVPVQLANSTNANANANIGNTNTNTGNADNTGSTNSGNSNNNNADADTDTSTNADDTNSNTNTNTNSNSNTNTNNDNTSSNTNSGTNTNTNTNSNNNADDDEEEEEEDEEDEDTQDARRRRRRRRRSLPKVLKRNATSFNSMLKRSPLLRRKVSPEDFAAGAYQEE